MPTTNKPRRVYHALDAARGLAALVVVLYHAQESLHAQWLPGGFLAVDFFFGLSGFVLAHAYADKLAGGQLPVKEFMVLRLIRLYPLYLLGLTLLMATLCLQAARSVGLPWSAAALLGKLPFALAMLPSPSKDPAGYLYPFNIPAWSIFLEVLVNLCYAVFYRPLKKPAIRWAVIVISALLLALQVFVLRVEQGGPAWNTLALGIPRVAFSFFLGVQLYEWHQQRHTAPRPDRPAAWSVLGLLLLLGCLALPAPPPLQLVFVLLAFPVLILLLSEARLPSGWSGNALRQLGVLSYAVYMLHFSVGFFWKDMLAVFGFAPLQWPMTVLPMLALTLLVCWCADRWFDRPIRALLQHWALGRRIPVSS